MMPHGADSSFLSFPLFYFFGSGSAKELEKSILALEGHPQWFSLLHIKMSGYTLSCQPCTIHAVGLLKQ